VELVNNEDTVVLFVATHGKASGSVTPTMARPLSMDIPGLWLMYEEVSSYAVVNLLMHLNSLLQL
jgi:hypothetical protein